MKYRVPGIVDNYRKLCVYCDSIWNSVIEAYPDEIACREGCGICCELRTVNQIEAYVIRSYIDNNKNFGDDKCDDDMNVDNDGIIVDTGDTNVNNGDEFIDNDNADACPFLRRQSCTIYPARPIICRTHGLILRSSEFPLSKQAASCPYNFPSIRPDDFPQELTADVDIITKNLVNLNLAFCMANGVSAEIRVLLRDLAEKLFS